MGLVTILLWVEIIACVLGFSGIIMMSFNEHKYWGKRIALGSFLVVALIVGYFYYLFLNGRTNLG
jgi:hypothetical protein